MCHVTPKSPIQSSTTNHPHPIWKLPVSWCCVTPAIDSWQSAIQPADVTPAHYYLPSWNSQWAGVFTFRRNVDDRSADLWIPVARITTHKPPPPLGQAGYGRGHRAQARDGSGAAWAPRAVRCAPRHARAAAGCAARGGRGVGRRGTGRRRHAVSEADKDMRKKW